MKKTLTGIFGLAIFAVINNSCKTDFDTIAPFKEMVCVYAMPEHNSNTNYIRINRVFLTEDNAYVDAQKNDSVNFADNELTVTLEKYRDGAWQNAFTLQEIDTVIPAGTFNQNQKLWVCNNQLASFGNSGTENNFDIKYKLIIKNNKSGKTYTSETQMVHDQPILPGQLQNSTINLTHPTSQVKMKWYNPEYGKINNLVIRFHYQEFPTNDTTVYVNKYVDWNLGSLTAADITATNEEVTFGFLGEDFYRAMANLIPEDPNIWGRKARGIVAMLTTCGEEFHLYAEVNGPSNTIVQDKPTYSNITDGVGLFSSRSRKNVPTTGYMKLTNPSLDKLAATAVYPTSPTCALKFVDANGNLGLGCP